MAEQAGGSGFKQHFRRSERLALALSLSIASLVLFSFYQYDRPLYDRLSFWEVRVPAFGLLFLICFAGLWLRERRHAARI